MRVLLYCKIFHNLAQNLTVGILEISLKLWPCLKKLSYFENLDRLLDDLINDMYRLNNGMWIQPQADLNIRATCHI